MSSGKRPLFVRDLSSTLETKPALDIRALVINKIVALKRPYLHYRLRAA